MCSKNGDLLSTKHAALDPTRTGQAGTLGRKVFDGDLWTWTLDTTTTLFSEQIRDTARYRLPLLRALPCLTNHASRLVT